MPLPERLEYHDLNGQEVFDLVHTRVFDFLSQIPELKKHISLSRVIVRLELGLDIWGTGPRLHLDQMELLAPENTTPGFVPVESHPSLDAIMDSRRNPPDQIREEHGLSVPRSIRNPTTTFHETQSISPQEAPKYPPAPLPDRSHLPEHLPANQPNPNAKNIGKRRFAAVVTQDYGAYVTGDRNLNEPPTIGGEKIASTGAGSDHGPVQPDFAAADFRQLPSDRVASIAQNAIQRGQKIDQEFRRPAQDSEVKDEEPQ